MPNKYRGEVEVKLGGKRRKLVFNANALAELEGILGKGALGMLGEMSDESGAAGAQHFRLARALLYVGLREGGTRVLSVESVGRRMQFDELPKYLEACTAGVLAALGADSKDAADAKAEDADPLAESESPPASST